MHTLIITGGSIHVSFARSYLQSHSFDQIIAADKGVEYAKKLEVIPDVILGDFDSLDLETQKFMRTWGIPITTFPAEKDYTDTHLAMEKAIEMGADEITVLAATGTRIDHTWANIGLLQMALQKGVQAWIVDQNNRISMWNHRRTIKKSEAFGDYISLIPYTEKVEGITLQGFYYPLQNEELTLGISRGISNQLISEVGVIDMKSGDLLIIESRD